MAGRRCSKKRDAVRELIRSSKSHPTAQWVYEQLKPRFPDLSLGTVYRNIKVLLEEGELASAGVTSGEERFDGEPRPHPHAICKRCGLIKDLPEIQTNFPLIPDFSIDLRNTVFYGLCYRCNNTGSRETTALGR